MKARALGIIVVAVALALAAVLWWRNRTPSAPANEPTAQVPAAPPLPPSPPAIAATGSAGPPALPASATPVRGAAMAAPEVPIQDGKTIDFSSGVPVVKDDAKEKALIDSAVKAMDDAAKDVTFGPSPPSTPVRPAAAGPEKK